MATANSTVPPSSTPSSSNVPPAPSNPPRSLLDHLVVILFALIGFGGALLLPLEYHIEPIKVSFLMATGIAALTYGYLGGISGASFVVGGLKLAGTAAALVGIALLINHHIVTQAQFQLVSDEDVLGPWKWVYGKGAASGRLYFERDKQGNLMFSGSQDKYTNENDHRPLYTVSNGKAILKNRNLLELSADVEDHLNNATMHWQADAPVELRPAFRGTMRATRPDGTTITNTWGIMLYKLKPGED